MIYLILLILGLSFGSFVNALVWRLYEQDKSLRSKRNDKLSITQGRSMCPNCKHELSAIDLFPIFSWLFLRGKCRYCKKPISWQYPIVELSTAILFVASYVFWPETLNASGIFHLVIWLISVVGFMALIVYDLRWLILPNKIIFPLIGLAVIGILADSLIFGGGINAITEATIGLLIGGGIFYLLFHVSDGKWIGGGDVKLGFLLGLLIGGVTKTLLLLFLASLIGSLVSLPLLANKKLKLKTQIPFGPLLIVAAIIVRLFGGTIVDWYANLLLI